MLAKLLELARDTRLMLTLLVGVAVAATVVSIALSFVDSAQLTRRMKSVSAEKQRLRTRERALSRERASLVKQPKPFMKMIVDRLSLSTWLGTANARARLASAGYRGPQAEIAFLFFRLATPIIFVFLTAFYLFAVDDGGDSVVFRLQFVVAAAYAGIKAPELYLTNVITKRQQSMTRAFPDALDLMLICVESGMSIELAFRKVAKEIGGQSVALAEELSLTNAELSYLPDRRMAYMNLAERTGLESVKQIATVLIQAEKYGTPLGQALRVSANESRGRRMIEAEKKAAALPPKLTVPMILFFLPVLMAVVLGPAIIQVMALNM